MTDTVNKREERRTGDMCEEGRPVCLYVFFLFLEVDTHADCDGKATKACLRSPHRRHICGVTKESMSAGEACRTLVSCEDMVFAMFCASSCAHIVALFTVSNWWAPRFQLLNCCIYAPIRRKLHPMRSVVRRIPMLSLHSRTSPTPTPIHTTHRMRTDDTHEEVHTQTRVATTPCVSCMIIFHPKRRGLSPNNCASSRLRCLTHASASDFRSGSYPRKW